MTERQSGDLAELTRPARAESNALHRDRYRWCCWLRRSRGVYAYRDGGVDELRPGTSPVRPTKLMREAEWMTRLDAGPLLVGGRVHAVWPGRKGR